MTGGVHAILVLVLVGLEAGLASVFRQVQAALLPWLARTPDELTHANTAVGVMQSAAMLGGPAIAAGLLAVSTPQAAMLAACGLTAVAAVVLAGVRPLSSQHPVEAVRWLKQLRLARGTLIATGALLVVIVALSVPSLTAIDHRISEPGPDLGPLRQVSFFGPLPFAIVEHLASELQPATYEPGHVIIQDGEPGNLFYMIADGRARVCKDGKQLRQMGTGESFGEIGLLRQIPRTATVIAMTRLQARTLTREEFLAAVTGNAASAEGADEVVSTRLRAG